MWKIHPDGTKEFTEGQESWHLAAAIADACPWFRPDVEEEQVADEERSCYNCRYRRWTSASFTCHARVLLR